MANAASTHVRRQKVKKRPKQEPQDIPTQDLFFFFSLFFFTYPISQSALLYTATPPRPVLNYFPQLPTLNPLSPMDKFGSKVRVFDAFPKVSPEHQQRSQRGGLSTMLTMLCGLMILWIQVGGYLGGYVDHQFAVDLEIRLELQINLDLLIAMPCQDLATNVMDITLDRYLASEVLNFQGTQFFVPTYFVMNRANQDYMTPELDQVMQETIRAEFSVAGARNNEEAPACHIFGSIPVNHVKGEFIIHPKQRSMGSSPAYNFTHVILEFSYGTFYPFITNPLDFTGKVTDDPKQAYRYFCKVVPTVYEKLGIVVDTYQYALTEIHRTTDKVPNLSFAYSFEPIKLTIREMRISFVVFVAKLATILSGLLIAAGYLFRLYESLLRILFGKRYTEKDTEKKEGGLLNHEVPDYKDY